MYFNTVTSDESKPCMDSNVNQSILSFRIAGATYSTVRLTRMSLVIEKFYGEDFEISGGIIAAGS